MQIFGLDAKTARDSQEVLAFLSACPFLAEAWPGWMAGQAAAALLAQADEAPQWWVAGRQGQWRWLVGLEPLEFDSQVFGRAMGRLAPLVHRQAWPEPAAQAQGQELISHVLGQAWAQGLEGLVARVPARDFLAARALEAMGFFLADLSVFFYFPNPAATIGIGAPALGEPVPIEEYVFYLTGFVTVLLIYIWADSFGSRPIMWRLRGRMKKIPASYNSSGASVVLGLVLIAAAIVYKRCFTDPGRLSRILYFPRSYGFVPAAAFFPRLGRSSTGGPSA